MSDEAKAGLFALVWEIFLYTGSIVFLITGKYWGYYLFLTDTLVQATILYYDYKLDKAQQRVKRTQQHLSKLSAEYSDWLREHNEYKTTIFKMTSYINGRKVKEINKRKIS